MSSTEFLAEVVEMFIFPQNLSLDRKEAAETEPTASSATRCPAGTKNLDGPVKIKSNDKAPNSFLSLKQAPLNVPCDFIRHST